MRVVFSRRAELGLTAIGDYIAKDNPRRAISFVEELRAQAKAIAKAPLASALTPGFEARSLRRRPYRKYLIFYVASVDHVLIVHIAHGAQDYEKELASTSPP